MFSTSPHEVQRVQRFRDELLEQHASDHVDLVLSNAGVFGASFVNGSRQQWGVYLRHQLVGHVFLRPRVPAAADRERRLCSRAATLTAVAGFWATAGPRAADHRLQSNSHQGSPKRSSKTWLQCAAVRVVVVMRRVS